MSDADILTLTRLNAKLNKLVGLSYNAVSPPGILNRISINPDDEVQSSDGAPTTVPLHTILDSAAALSGTMCAPPSWVTGAPIVGFSPPAPYAHEIRNGVLNRLERERAVGEFMRRKAEEEGRRRKMEGAVDDGPGGKRVKVEVKEVSGGGGSVVRTYTYIHKPTTASSIDTDP